MTAPRPGRRLKVFFDGGCRPNPGPIEVAVVVRGTPRFFDDLGTGTNTAAEWQALLCALSVARALDAGPVELIGDSREVIDRANAILATGRAARDDPPGAMDALAALRPARIRWTRRAQNLAGIALEARRAGLWAASGSRLRSGPGPG